MPRVPSGGSWRASIPCGSQSISSSVLTDFCGYSSIWGGCEDRGVTPLGTEKWPLSQLAMFGSFFTRQEVSPRRLLSMSCKWSWRIVTSLLDMLIQAWTQRWAHWVSILLYPKDVLIEMGTSFFSLDISLLTHKMIIEINAFWTWGLLYI